MLSGNRESAIELQREFAEVGENFTNSAGHKDLVLVKSALGYIHLTATNDIEPNSKVRTEHFQEGHQNFLADKAYVVYGRNARDGRLVLFVPASEIHGKSELTKSEIRKLSDGSLNAVLNA